MNDGAKLKKRSSVSSDGISKLFVLYCFFFFKSQKATKATQLCFNHSCCLPSSAPPPLRPHCPTSLVTVLPFHRNRPPGLTPPSASVSGDLPQSFAPAPPAHICASCGVEVRADIMGADGSCRRSPLIAAAAATALRYGSQRARDSIWQLLFGQACAPLARVSLRSISPGSPPPPPRLSSPKLIPSIFPCG